MRTISSGSLSIFRCVVLKPTIGILTNSAVSFTDNKRLKAFLLGAVFERTIDHGGVDRAADQRGETGVRAAGDRRASVTSLLGSRPLRLSS